MQSCAVCGIRENGKKLSLHHIDYDPGNNDPSNLIPLCGSCHSKTKGNRKYWIGYFTELKRDWVFDLRPALLEVEVSGNPSPVFDPDPDRNPWLSKRNRRNKV